MPATLAPQTLSIGQQITSFLSNLTYPSTGLTVYTLVQLEAIKDITNYVANGGACAEVYGHQDGSERRGFGGRIWDTQSWFILSMCSLTTPAYAQNIYNVRDALVIPFQTHATLGTAVYNLFHAQLDEKQMSFRRIERNGQVLRAHLAVLTTKQEWQVVSPPGVIA